MATENPSTNSDLELAMAKAEVARLKETLKEDVNLWSSTKVLLNDLILQVEKNAEVVESKFSACLQSLEALKEQVQDISSRFGPTTSPVNVNERATAVITVCDKNLEKKEKDLSPFTTSPSLDESATAVVLDKKENDLSTFTTSPSVDESASAVVLEKKEKDLSPFTTSRKSWATALISDCDRNMEKKEKEPSVISESQNQHSEKEPSVKDKCEQESAYTLTSEAVMSDTVDSSSDKELRYLDVNWNRRDRNVKREWDKVKEARRISSKLRKKKWVTEAYYLSGYLGSTSRQTTEKLDSEVSESEADFGEVSKTKKRKPRFQKAPKNAYVKNKRFYHVP